KRNAKHMEYMDPRKLDRALLQEMGEKYGYPDHIAALKARDGWPDPDAAGLTGGLANLDDFSACEITRKSDWTDLYVTPFYFANAVRMFGTGNPRFFEGTAVAKAAAALLANTKATATV